MTLLNCELLLLLSEGKQNVLEKLRPIKIVQVTLDLVNHLIVNIFHFEKGFSLLIKCLNDILNESPQDNLMDLLANFRIDTALVGRTTVEMCQKRQKGREPLVNTEQ